MIEIKNLSKSYNKGTVKAVDDLNLTVKNGEIFGILDLLASKLMEPAVY